MRIVVVVYDTIVAQSIGLVLFVSSELQPFSLRIYEDLRRMPHPLLRLLSLMFARHGRRNRNMK